jgi:hypothetical protein
MYYYIIDMSTIKQLSENTLKTRLLARSRRLGETGVSLGGSMTRILRKCGKKQCRCADDPAARHEAYILTWKETGRTHAQYVPVDMIKDVQNWIEERKRIKRLLAEIDTLALDMVRAHAAANRAGAKKERRP